MQSFIKEYGTRGFSLMVRELISRCPDQLNQSQLASEIELALQKLQAAFEGTATEELASLISITK